MKRVPLYGRADGEYRFFVGPGRGVQLKYRFVVVAGFYEAQDEDARELTVENQ